MKLKYTETMGLKPEVNLIMFLVASISVCSAAMTTGRLYRQEDNLRALTDDIRIVRTTGKNKEQHIQCMFECNARLSCTAVNLFKNRSCQLVQSPRYDLVPCDGCYVISAQRSEPAGSEENTRPTPEPSRHDLSATTRTPHKYVYNKTEKEETGYDATRPPKCELNLESLQPKFDASMEVDGGRKGMSRFVKMLNTQVCPEGFGNLFRPMSGDAAPSCYKLSSESLTWQRARDYCLSRNADLISIETPQENSHITMIIMDKAAWTSGSDVQQEGHYKWLATGADVVYFSWKTHQPDDHKGVEDFIEVSGIYWNDVPCLKELHALCEIQAKL